MKSFATVGLACATALVSVLIGAYTFETRARANDLVNVTGLAKRDFVSDLVVWKGHFVRRDPSLKAASEGLRRDLDAVNAYGVAVGLLAALFLARLLASLLFGVSAHDGPTFLAVAMVLLGAAAAACFLPARRAIGLARAVLLRSE